MEAGQETTPEDESAVALDFLSRLLADVKRGKPLLLEEYQRAYAGYESVIAEEYENHVNARTGEDPSSTATASPQPLHIDRFEVLQRIGRGGQGVVYLAHDPRLGRRVAIKLLRNAEFAEPEAHMRLQREAEVASRIDHPNICRIYDAGIHAGCPFLAMQFVAGQPLSEIIRSARDGQSPPTADSRGSLAWTLRVFEKIAHALHAAHENGVIHRDVKPANVMITSKDEPVLMDFGLARDTSSEAPTLTRSGDVFGTPAYMSPEQVAGRTSGLDARTDVWSLGVSLYEAVALERPFEGPTPEALYQAIRETEPRPLRRSNPAVGRDLATVIATAMAKAPAHRYETARKLAEDIGRVRAGTPIAARRPSLAGRAVRFVRRHPAWTIGFLAIASALNFLVPVMTGHFERQRLKRVGELQLRGYGLLAAPESSDASRFGDIEQAFLEVLELAPRNLDAILGVTLVRSEYDGTYDVRMNRALAWLARHPEAVEQSYALRLLRDLSRDPSAQTPRPSRADRTARDWFVMGLVSLNTAERAKSPVLRRRHNEIAHRNLTRATALATDLRLHYGLYLCMAAARLQDPKLIWVATDILAHLDDGSSWGVAFRRAHGLAARAARLMDARERRALFEEALKLYRRVLVPDARPGDVATSVNMALILQDQVKRPREALELITTSLERWPGSPSLLTRSARIRMALGDMAGARRDARAALKTKLRRDEAHFVMALIHRKQDDLAGAAEWFKRVVSIDPGRAAAWVNLAHVYLETGRHAAARHAASRAFLLEPERDTAQRALGAVLIGSTQAWVAEAWRLE